MWARRRNSTTMACGVRPAWAKRAANFSRDNTSSNSANSVALLQSSMD